MKNINWKSEIRQSAVTMIWFTMLTFPLLVMKVRVSSGVADVSFRWLNVGIIAVAAFILSFIWRYSIRKRDERRAIQDSDSDGGFKLTGFLGKKMANPKIKWPVIIAGAAVAAAYPFVSGMYHTNIMISALIWIMLGLGLNIVIGLGGMLNLGYAAFYCVGAYTYGLIFKYMNTLLINWGVNSGLLFWICMPLAGLTSAIFGILLSLPVLRLRGDYLAIVTLAFGQIVRIVIQNMSKVTGGATGISLIPRPWFFGVNMTPRLVAPYLYFIVLALVILTIFIVRRLENSRIGRSWEAMREDEIACQSMGINLVTNKLTSFALGAVFAGVAGVLFAAQTTYINPDSFTVWESVLVLCVVVLGGMGSIPGVILGALIIKLLPEYLRAFSQYRMLVFGLSLVLMMIFRPGGIIQKVRRRYTFKAEEIDPELKGESE